MHKTRLIALTYKQSLLSMTNNFLKNLFPMHLFDDVTRNFHHPRGQAVAPLAYNFFANIGKFGLSYFQDSATYFSESNRLTKFDTMNRFMATNFCVKVARGYLLERRHPFLNRILGR